MRPISPHGFQLYKRLLCLAVVILGLQAGCFGQKGLFWAVTLPGRTDTSWLLGTIHTYPKRVVELPAIVTDKLSVSKQLYIEIQLDWKMVVQILTTGTISSEMMPSEDKAWTEEDWDNVKAWFISNNHLDEASFKQLRGTTNAEDRLTSMYMAAYGCEAGAVENDLKVLAKQRKIPIKGLDRDWSEIQTWYAHYADLSDQAWAQGSLDSLLEAGYYELADLFVAYAAQDSNFIGHSSPDGLWKDGLTLVEWRNTQWMSQLRQLMKQQSFVAVGAAHLYGPLGVINLLQGAGFQCTPVEANFGGPRLQRFIERNSRQYKVVH
jgi:uncharacterized protein